MEITTSIEWPPKTAHRSFSLGYEFHVCCGAPDGLKANAISMTKALTVCDRGEIEAWMVFWMARGCRLNDDELCDAVMDGVRSPPEGFEHLAAF